MNATETPVDQIAAEDWAGDMGDRWLAHLAAFEGMIAPVGDALMAAAAFAPGERVLDVGCGAGGTSVEIARRVGAAGTVLGIDISPALIEAATRRARAANADNLRLQCADAATLRLDAPHFDRLFSRFGLLFFPQPTEAFANLHGLLRRGARADFSAWAPAMENAWVAQLVGVFAQHIEMPAPVPHAPGPFAFDDPAYLRRVLEEAGFDSVGIEVWRGTQPVGGPGASPQGAADFALEALHFGELLEKSNPAARETVRAQLIELFTRHRSSAGIVMDATAFLVTARA